MSQSRWNTIEDDAPRDRHDAGEVSKAWRWFSDHTRLAASHYTDLPWIRLSLESLVAIVLISLARLFPNEGFAPFLLIGSVLWMANLVRISAIKLADQRGWLQN